MQECNSLNKFPALMHYEQQLLKAKCSFFLYIYILTTISKILHLTNMTDSNKNYAGKNVYNTSEEI